MATTACKYCGKRKNKETMLRQSANYFCSDQCLEAYKRQTADRRALTDYIQELYGEFPRSVTKQMEDFKAQGMTYKGQELSLRYWYDTLGHELDASKGIGIIPFCYDAAKRHFLDRQRVARLAQDRKDDEVVYVQGNRNDMARKAYLLRRDNNDL